MGSVRVQVKLGDKKRVLEVSEGTTVETLLKRLEPKWQHNVIVMANGKMINLSDKINASDRVVILPMLAGG